jgi:hypothetical protein
MYRLQIIENEATRVLMNSPKVTPIETLRDKQVSEL